MKSDRPAVVGITIGAKGGGKSFTTSVTVNGEPGVFPDGVNAGRCLTQGLHGLKVEVSLAQVLQRHGLSCDAELQGLNLNVLEGIGAEATSTDAAVTLAEVIPGVLSSNIVVLVFSMVGGRPSETLKELLDLVAFAQQNFGSQIRQAFPTQSFLFVANFAGNHPGWFQQAVDVLVAIKNDKNLPDAIIPATRALIEKKLYGFPMDSGLNQTPPVMSPLFKGTDPGAHPHLGMAPFLTGMREAILEVQRNARAQILRPKVWLDLFGRLLKAGKDLAARNPQPGRIAFRDVLTGRVAEAKKKFIAEQQQKWATKAMDDAINLRGVQNKEQDLEVKLTHTINREGGVKEALQNHELLGMLGPVDQTLVLTSIQDALREIAKDAWARYDCPEYPRLLGAGVDAKRAFKMVVPFLLYLPKNGRGQFFPPGGTFYDTRKAFTDTVSTFREIQDFSQKTVTDMENMVSSSSGGMGISLDGLSLAASAAASESMTNTRSRTLLHSFVQTASKKQTLVVKAELIPDTSEARRLMVTPSNFYVETLDSLPFPSNPNTLHPAYRKAFSEIIGTHVPMGGHCGSLDRHYKLGLQQTEGAAFTSRQVQGRRNDAGGGISIEGLFSAGAAGSEQSVQGHYEAFCSTQKKVASIETQYTIGGGEHDPLLLVGEHLWCHHRMIDHLDVDANLKQRLLAKKPVLARQYELYMVEGVYPQCPLEACKLQRTLQPPAQRPLQVLSRYETIRTAVNANQAFDIFLHGESRLKARVLPYRAPRTLSEEDYGCFLISVCVTGMQHSPVSKQVPAKPCANLKVRMSDLKVLSIVQRLEQAQPDGQKEFVHTDKITLSNAVYLSSSHVELGFLSISGKVFWDSCERKEKSKEYHNVVRGCSVALSLPNWSHLRFTGVAASFPNVHCDTLRQCLVTGWEQR
uniref:Uncharacterized protein n=1 Tax=Chromera velia CCMP2878 TaxID=1169474 RepID=A0A0G4F113_9ALVE|eukprot:Cvel_2636.t1-p1 / transcript=Cvel_2636.t1 / gene=Cvel_2636 / organism=Chromera_velia_CCMP2878 / gene_product=hypothetical protein / transcript_product=hypothetical protein / location=Cvel_scaffold104:86162-89534(-) / protein_length=915 / sequence_SO=supercontig / SO=protein_coding / is_pseudo=false